MRSNNLVGLPTAHITDSRKLRAHSSCINALALSSNGGRFLASGGDDLEIHLWDFHQDDLVQPSHTYIGPRSNIFCLEFSQSNKFLFAGGTDAIVHQYDVSQLERGTLSRNEKLPMSIFREEDIIRDVTCSPFRDELYLSASENGRVIQHDARIQFPTNTRAADILQIASEVTSVQFHPTMEHLFVTGDIRGDVCLRDTRMAFGPLRTRNNGGRVRTFQTALARRTDKNMCKPESSSVAFDKTGEKLAVTSLHYYPTIYALSDPYPIAICTANAVEKLPGERTYSNSCTMKHGCFGGIGIDNSGIEYYCGGSDDFCAYLWKIPPVEHLVAQREEIPGHEWYLEDSSAVGFTEDLNSSKYVPAEISQPSAILKGHNSIVNTTLIHPQYPLIFAAGIENTITLHSPFSSCPFSRQLSLTPREVRRLSSTATAEEGRVIASLLLGIEPADSEDNDEAERDTIRLFDGILRREGQADPFEVSRWLGADEGSSSGDEQTLDTIN
ncbi:WD40 repeat-like protein [Lentinula raphanica]|nr:WD40 repeat-like protein [Lentinula raphanica]